MSIMTVLIIIEIRSVCCISTGKISGKNHLRMELFVIKIDSLIPSDCTGKINSSIPTKLIIIKSKASVLTVY